ncbi:MAG TPA: dihydroneopterin aldolase, partial [Paracoccus sp. (in: a-proteobacteria)]|nr:dihydroneopterin aldolase [Paracoccus sp. (in: a-proteobacteria)]
QAARAQAGRLGMTVADSRTELDWAAGEGRAVVWAPARMAADVAGLDADARELAFWIAGRLDAARLDWALPDGTALPAPPAGFRVPMGRARA